MEESIIFPTMYESKSRISHMPISYKLFKEFITEDN